MRPVFCTHRAALVLLEFSVPFSLPIRLYHIPSVGSVGQPAFPAIWPAGPLMCRVRREPLKRVGYAVLRLTAAPGSEVEQIWLVDVAAALDLRQFAAAKPARWLAGSASISSSRRAVPQPPAPTTSGAARGAAPGMLSVSHAWERSKLSEQSSGMLSVSLAHLDQRFLRFAPC